MSIPPEIRFRNAVSAAMLATPGGMLFKADIKGLLKRAASMDIPADQARQVITAMNDRPRHHVTRGIE